MTAPKRSNPTEYQFGLPWKFVLVVPALVIGAFVAGLLGFAVKGAPTTIMAESQAWWSSTGITVPSVVGHHIHLQATIPAPGVVVNGRVDVPVHLTLHDQVGSPNFVRWSDGSAVRGSLPLSRSDFACTTHDGFTDCQADRVLPIDFAGFGTGLRELRLTLNVPDEQPTVSGNQRMFQSTGFEVCVRACSPVAEGGRSLDYLEARGWYDDSGTTGAHGYQNARITSGIASVRPGGTVRMDLHPGSGGRPTTFSGVYLDPNMHLHDAGRVLLTRNGPFQGTVTIPDLAPGAHKLVAVASDGMNAGVLSIPFTVAGSEPSAPPVSPSPPPLPSPSVCGVP